MTILNDPRAGFAMAAVRQATDLVANIQRRLAQPAAAKKDRSPVTVADFAAQALVSHLLQEQFPKDTLVAEEDTAILKSAGGEVLVSQILNFIKPRIPDITASGIFERIEAGTSDTAERFWTLDPIDGTKGFIRGDHYAVALAFVNQGQVEIGVLGCPNLGPDCRPQVGAGALVIAVQGKGTWSAAMAGEDLKQITASKIADPKSARVLRSFESAHTNTEQIDTFTREMGIASEPVRMDSQAKYALLAAGQGDLLLRLLSPDKPDYKEKIWDQAAGALIIEEAGGKISDLDGKPLDFTMGRRLENNRGILASNGQLHEKALAALNRIGA